MLEPRTSPMRLVEALPARRLASCHFTASHSKCSWTSAAKTSSASSIWPTLLPAVFLTSSFMAGLSGLDLDVDAGRQVELHERVEGLLRRLEDVEQALVGPDLELLTRLLVGVRRPEDAVLVDLGGQRDRARDLGPGTLGGLDDLAGGLIEELVVVGLEPDANPRGGHGLIPGSSEESRSLLKTSFNGRAICGFLQVVAPTD